MGEDLFPSGPWRGFFNYSRFPDRHRMSLSLTFSKGMIHGEGEDYIGSFIISGRYDVITQEAHWTKAYVGKHDVFYQGFREGKFIWGTWEISHVRGGFKIWPVEFGDTGDEAETEKKGRGQPVDAVGELVEAGAPDPFRGRSGRGLIDSSTS